MQDLASHLRETSTVFKTQDSTISPHICKPPPTLGRWQLKMKFSPLVFQPYLLSSPSWSLLVFKFYWEETY